MLANQRLRIIDVHGGDQPIYNEDGDVVVVYNGEIYNFRTLREELETAGHRFSTDSDTEVLVHGYEEYGPEIFGRLNGMFSVALWDSSSERFYLARDRTGIKPLYVASTSEGLLFASEPKAILHSGLVTPTVDTNALQFFLQLRYSPPTESLFEGLEKVQPGTYLEGERTDEGWNWSSRTYWSPTISSDLSGDLAGLVRSSLRRAVERQLVSDVPVGFYLSGGLDTSSVVAMASELSDDPIQTFCMGFDDSEWDERPDARAVADHFGTEHHEIEIKNDFMRDFPRMIWHADEPKRNLYPYYVAQEMSDHVTVALGGLGADELFGGYVYRYTRLEELEQIRSIDTGGVKRSLNDLTSRLAQYQLEEGSLEEDYLFEDIDVLRHIDDSAALYVLLNSSDVLGDVSLYRNRVFGDALVDGADPSVTIAADDPEAELSLRERALYWDFTVKLPNDFLLVEDRMSMAHSLESRVPFLDNDLVDLALQISLASKFYGKRSTPFAGKAILREAMKPVLPPTVFEKSKQGFTMPTYAFARDELIEHAQCILNDPHIVEEGLIDSSYIERLLARKPSEDLTPHYKLLWKIVGLEIWHQMYVTNGLQGPAPIERYYT